MLVPLARLGSRIVFPSGGSAMTVAGRLGTAALQAVAGWLCICVPLGFLLYFTLQCLLRRNRNQWLPFTDDRERECLVVPSAVEFFVAGRGDAAVKKYE
jgi:hypothetical protein